MADLVGQSVAGYPITRILGKGACGVACEAATSASPVVIKLLDEELRSDKELNAAVAAGWEHARAVTHEHLVPILAAGLDPEHGAYCMTEFQGNVRSLQTLILQGTELAWRDVLEITAQVAAGLQALHGAGVMHGHVTPFNVLITPDQDVKLEGAGGLAKLGRALQQVVEGPALSYAPPERLAGGDATPATDLYGLGTCLYLMVARQGPFPGADPGKVCEAILEKEPVPVRQLREDVPAGVEEFIGRLMAKDLAQRYGEAADVLADLAALKAGNALAPLRPGPAFVAPERAPASPQTEAYKQRSTLMLQKKGLPGGSMVFGNLETQVGSSLPKSAKEKEGDELFHRGLLPAAVAAWQTAWETGYQHPGLRAKLDLAQIQTRKQNFEALVREIRYCLGKMDVGGAAAHIEELRPLAESDSQRSELATLENRLSHARQEAGRGRAVKLLVAAAVVVIVALAGLLWLVFLRK